MRLLQPLLYSLHRSLQPLRAHFSNKRGAKPSEWKLRQLQQRYHMQPSMGEEGALRSDLFQGLVVERQGDRLMVEGEGGTVFPCLQSKAMAEAKIRAVVGDRVLYDDKQTVVTIEARKNVLQRPVSSSRGGRNKLELKLIASNIDALLIVVSIVPFAPPISIDRFLVAARELGIPHSFIVVNKMDLPMSKEYFESLMYYNTIGYPVVGASTVPEDGLKDLRHLLAGKTSVFVGQSGVGKSSIISALIPAEDIFIRELGGKHGDVGTHTTNNAKLYRLAADGTAIIDSPGIRELGTWHLRRGSIAAGFPDIHSVAAKCKYRNCRHTIAEAEHGACAVRGAIDMGDVHPDRLQSFLSLMNR